MVKVIRRAPPPKPKQISCKCGARLEYTTDDIETMPGDRPTDAPSDYITCPDCKKGIWLKH